jgi:hypothetical protein
MVYLALDRTSALDVIRFVRGHAHAIWVGADVISREEHQRFVSEGVNLTRFGYSVDREDAEVMAMSLETIREHHPGETIWVQHVPAP